MAAIGDLVGLDTVKHLLGKLPGLVIDATIAALQREADAIMDRSKTEFVPVLTGSLRDSGAVSEARLQYPIASVTLSYGGLSSSGVDVNYAVQVHEDLSMNHPRGGEAKFLERPFFEAEAGMGQRMAETITAELARGGR